jgi:hypothetical protein
MLGDCLLFEKYRKSANFGVTISRGKGFASF